jgi:hypothetical protein
MTKRGTDGRRMQTDHDEGAVRHFAGEFDHARSGRQEIDRRRRRASVPAAGRCRAELDAVPGEQPPEIADRFPHESHRRARLPDAARRNEAGGHGETGAARRDFLQAVGERSENQRMPHQGARSGREQLQALGSLGRQRQRQVRVAAAGRMVVNADAVEARLLAAGGERRELGQWPADRNSERDADPRHLMNSSRLRGIPDLLGNVRGVEMPDDPVPFVVPEPRALQQVLPRRPEHPPRQA